MVARSESSLTFICEVRRRSSAKSETFPEKSRKLPVMPCRFIETKMAANSAQLMIVVVCLFFQFVPANTEDSFDRFLKSDHTNNWAVLVRTKRKHQLQISRSHSHTSCELILLKAASLLRCLQVCTSRFWFNYRHVANVLSMYRSVKRLGIPDRYDVWVTLHLHQIQKHFFIACLFQGCLTAIVPYCTFSHPQASSAPSPPRHLLLSNEFFPLLGGKKISKCQMIVHIV